MIKYLLAAALATAAAFSLAQVKVVESQPIMTPPPPAPAGTKGTPSNQLIQLYYQVQALQQEVLQLRGMVEQQAYELRQLKQQHMNDYLDLDQRLSRLSQTGSAIAPGSDDLSGVPAPRDELADYRAAINLVLKQQDYDQGIKALKQHLVDYPNGHYAPNAQYWLGQIYLLKNQLEKSRQWFVAMLEDYPEHPKAPEAKFKLGKVYNLLGDKAQARALLEEVASSNTSAAGLARQYLEQNFSS